MYSEYVTARRSAEDARIGSAIIFGLDCGRTVARSRTLGISPTLRRMLVSAVCLTMLSLIRRFVAWSLSSSRILSKAISILSYAFSTLFTDVMSLAAGGSISSKSKLDKVQMESGQNLST